MAVEDQTHWDAKYRDRFSEASEPRAPGLPAAFADFADRFTTATHVLEIACGAGRASVWFAQQGAEVIGYDISAVAIGQANALAQAHGVADRCMFVVTDFDDGLPAGEPVDIVMCHMFRDARLDRAILDRLRPNGLVAMAALSEVGAKPGRFRVGPGELLTAFAECEVLAHHEADGVAWLLATKRSHARPAIL